MNQDTFWKYLNLWNGIAYPMTTIILSGVGLVALGAVPEAPNNAQILWMGGPEHVEILEGIVLAFFLFAMAQFFMSYAEEWFNKQKSFRMASKRASRKMNRILRRL